MHWFKYMVVITASCIVTWFVVGGGYTYTLMNHPRLTFYDIGNAYLYTTSTTDSFALFATIILSLVMAFALVTEMFFLSRFLPDVWNLFDSYGSIDRVETHQVSRKTIKWVSK